jgi:hypothetical protein
VLRDQSYRIRMVRHAVWLLACEFSIMPSQGLMMWMMIYRRKQNMNLISSEVVVKTASRKLSVLN